jgi:hypothetical protein
MPQGRKTVSENVSPADVFVVVATPGHWDGKGFTNDLREAKRFATYNQCEPVVKQLADRGIPAVPRYVLGAVAP